MCIRNIKRSASFDSIKNMYLLQTAYVLCNANHRMQSKNEIGCARMKI